MATREIRPSTPQMACDVCGRTLLRGERAEAYLHGGARRWVCELCKSRALHEGWIREGTIPDYDETSAGPERRRSLFGRLRARRAPINLDFDDDEAVETPEPPPRRARERRPARPSRPVRAPREPRDAPSARDPWSESAGEPRHVRAVPTSHEQRSLAATEAFNASEHRRTVSGVARSLGLPAVAVLPSATHPSLVSIVVSWELCWYRYEVDLAEEPSSVRVVGQGYELDELADHERLANAAAAEDGSLDLGP